MCNNRVYGGDMGYGSGGYAPCGGHWGLCKECSKKSALPKNETQSSHKCPDCGASFSSNDDKWKHIYQSHGRSQW